MKHFLLAIALFATSLFSFQAVAVPIPSPPQLNANSWILMDFATGKVLSEHNADERIEPASITKIMTSYVVYQAIDSGLISMSDSVPVSEKAWRMKGSRMFIEVGKSVPLEALLKGLVIQSGNDAAVALAEYVGGTEEAFAEQMNAAAKALGMTGSHFVNSTGWPHADHYTTARDIAILSHALIRDYPEHYRVYAEKNYTYNSIKQPNRNALLWRDSSVDGIKTGHTEAAGYCLAASARRDDMRLISVVMGTESSGARSQYSQTLLNYGFRYYETRKLYAAGASLNAPRVWKGSIENLPIGPASDLYVTIPRGQYKNLKPSLDGVPNPLEAPVAKGTQLGTIRVKLGEEVVAEAPAVALEQVDEGDFFSSAWDSILLMFE